jgi:hypothetical protein
VKNIRAKRLKISARMKSEIERQPMAVCGTGHPTSDYTVKLTNHNHESPKRCGFLATKLELSREWKDTIAKSQKDAELTNPPLYL